MMNEVLPNSANGITPKKFLTRKPLFIFNQLKNANGEEKALPGKLLKELKEKMPVGYKVGAAVGKGDSFFDALAQGLGELKESGQIEVDEKLDVTYLRKCCLERHEYMTEERSGELAIEGKIICELLGVKIKVLELSYGDETAGCVEHTKVGRGKHVVWLVKDGKHFVPLLAYINEDVTFKYKIAEEEIYGAGVRKRKVDDLEHENSKPKKARLASNEMDNTDFDFTMTNGLHSTLKIDVEKNDVDKEQGCVDGGAILNEFVTRKPMPIFVELKKSNDKVEKKKLSELLDALKACLPAGFHIGAAVGKADNFFDALAQGLQELQEKGVNFNHKELNVRTLRFICGQYALNFEGAAAWLKSALKAVDEKLAFYKDHIKYTVEDIGYSEEVVSGRLEIEGKIISELLGIKIKVFELCIDELGVENYIKHAKMGKVKNIVYLVKHSEHFVPLLRHIESDVTRKIKVSKVEVYGLDSRKRKLLEAVEERDTTKFARLDVSVINNSNLLDNDAALPNNLPVEACSTTLLSVDELNKRNLECLKNLEKKMATESAVVEKFARTFEPYVPSFRSIPYRLLSLLYHLDLSALCLLRKSMHQAKYPALSLTFGDSAMEKFNDIIINYKNKSICLQIENVDNYYMDFNINFGKLFSKEKRSFSLNYYFEYFVKWYYAQAGNSVDSIKYLVIYTNAGLDLTEDNKLKRGRYRDFCAFKFVELEKRRILKNFLKFDDDVDEHVKGRGFYQFSKDDITRNELMMRLKFFNNEDLDELKAQFLDKLVFAVGQPDREELNAFIRNELKANRNVEVDVAAGVSEVDYQNLQKHALKTLAVSKKLEHNLLYDLNLLLCFLQHMLLAKNELNSINTASFVKKNDIILNFNDKVCYVSIYHGQKSIGHAQLFPSRQQPFSVNTCFHLYLENLKKFRNLSYFIVYSNVALNLTKEYCLKKVRSSNFHAFKFYNLDLEKEDYKIFKDFACINTNGLYHFSKKENTKLLKLLKLPSCFVGDDVEKIKTDFLKKLIFAVDQPSTAELECILKQNEIKVSYDFEALQEIATRWSESHEFDALTKDISQRLLQDIKNNVTSQQRIARNIEKEIKFAKAMARKYYREFLDYILIGGGKCYLEMLKKANIRLSSVSSMLGSSKEKGFAAFKNLCELWFDEDGNKSQYLKTLERERIDLAQIASVLHGSRDDTPKAFLDFYYVLFDYEGNGTKYLNILKREGIPFSSIFYVLQRSKIHAAKAFKELFNLWFDEQGNKTKYLKTLEKENIELKKVCSLIGAAGANAARNFKNFHHLWFDCDGNKTQYLRTLQKENINLTNVSGILSGSNAIVETFKSLYNLWFDDTGKKTKYLMTLEREGINLASVSSILHKSRDNAAIAFLDLYNTCFDEDGKKTKHLQKLHELGIDLSDLSGMLHGARKNATVLLKDLYDLWVDDDGNKTHYLTTLEKQNITLKTFLYILIDSGQCVVAAFKNLHNLLFDAEGNKSLYLTNLEKNGIQLSDMTSFIRRSKLGVTIAFRDLYELWIDEAGNKRQCLLTLEKENISLKNMSSILCDASMRSASAFKELYDVFFDEKGNQTQYLKVLREEKIALKNIFSILHGVGTNAAKLFKDLYNLWFDKAGNKTQYLSVLEENGVSLSNVSSILNGAGINAAEAFKNLYNLWFDANGNKTKYLDTLECEGISLQSISSILHGTGNKAAKAFKELFETFFDEEGNMKMELQNFLNSKDEKGKNFKLKNLSSILTKTGAKARNAFLNLHNVCFDENGKQTQLLRDFYAAEFKSSNLSSILFGTGARAPDMLKGLHSVCFEQNDGSSTTPILNDFVNLGFKPGNLCSMLSGKQQNLAKHLKHFHDFCFKAEHTSKYLNRFLSIENGFTPSKLSKILHGAGANICVAFKDFHDVCFEEQTEEESELLFDFRRVGFMPSDLTNILSMAGSNAAMILSQFHKVCFNKKNYLQHFLDEFEIFTPKTLARILHGVGVDVRTIFKALHRLCFDEEGNKTKYLNKLVNKRPSEVTQTLYERVKSG